MLLHELNSDQWYVRFPRRAPDVTARAEGRPTTVNHYTRHANGAHYKTPQAAAWTAQVQGAVHNALVAHRARLAPPVAVMVVLINVTGDADNYLKNVNDGVAAALHINDKHFHPVAVDKRKIAKQPKGAVIHLWGHDPKGAA